MKLLVIILNYRVADLTIQCLRSLAGQMPSGTDWRVAVVENGSGDGSAQRIREAIREQHWESWVELTELPRNLGFTKGNNLMIRKSMEAKDRPQYILLLNADTIVSPGAISRLLDFMDRNAHAGIAGPRLEFGDGRPQGSPFRFLSMASEFDRGLGLGIVSQWLRKWAVCPPKPQAATKVDWVAGAAMMIRREVIEALGPLDEGFFAYFEDTDYCLGARRAGWSTWYVPESLVIHFEGSSSGIQEHSRTRLPEYWFRARRRFFLKNYGALYAAMVDGLFLLGCGLGWLRRKIQGKVDPNPSHLLMDSLRHSVFWAGFKLEAGL